ncbi:MAG: glycosyltransferase family 4 protein [Chloroflexi bacterium]|nr:glycosyltransferase family 4 protein [Chloroflexota bacterium]
MRIGFFSWESIHSIAVGGGGIHVTELSAALERKGHEVHVFTRMGYGQPQYERIHGVYYHRCPFELHPNFFTEIENMNRSFIQHLWQTEDYIGPFDVLHAHDWLTAKSLVWAKDGRGRRGLFTIHSTEYGRCGNHHHNGNSEKVRNVEWEGAFRADRVIAVSNTLKQEIMNIYHIPDWKIRTIYNGVPVHDYNGWIDPGPVKARYDIGPMDPTFLFVGRMVYQKGPDLLVEAIPSALICDRRAKFVFAGDGDMRIGLENRCRALGVSQATRFLGMASRETLRDLYRVCDAVVVPSRNEPFGIVILEAWSAGKPVVATVNGGPSEFVWHNITGLKVYAAPESIAWGVRTIMGNYEHARWMGGNGRYAAESAFSWDGIADRVLDVYHELGA